jgi:lipopolysaccharide transport system ATP-binding protein
MNDEVLVSVQNVSKKFCRDLKTSLWYGVKDLTSEFFGRSKDGELRPKEFYAVNDVSFELRRGECLGLIGHNGAGKSTLLKMLNGLIKPDKGTITMKGRIGALIELGAGFNPLLTGRENIYINGAVLGFSKKEIDEKFDAIVEFSEIGDFIDTPVQNYSSGMKVRLGFAVAAQLEPDVLLIDEVLAVGDIGFRIKSMNRITELIKRSCVIFVSHSMPLVARMTDKAILMNHGVINLMDSKVDTVIQKYYELDKDTGERISGFEGINFNSIIVNSLDKGKNTINWGDSLRIKTEIDSNKPFKNCYITIVFDNPEYLPIASCYSKLFDLESGENTIELIIDKIYFSPTKYTMRILLHQKENGRNQLKSTILKRLQGVGTFTVKVNGSVNIDPAFTQLPVITKI